VILTNLDLLVFQMGAQAMASNKFHISETAGCLMFLSAGVQALLGHKSMAEMVRCIFCLFSPRCV
jgi:hypothetical protein